MYNEVERAKRGSGPSDLYRPGRRAVASCRLGRGVVHGQEKGGVIRFAKDILDGLLSQRTNLEEKNQFLESHTHTAAGL